MKPSKQSLSYRDSGVDIDKGNQLIDRIKPHVKRTHREGVMGGLGGFGALFELPLNQYKEPVLVSGTDGVGTKLKLATELGIHDTIGIDLVAMCVNDIVVAGAEPLYFLDYFACGSLDLDQAEAVISGIAKGCELSGCALTGGETAEMPGMYTDGEYDLAGFAVGIVEKSQILTTDKVKEGDAIIGLASSGPHSNGYSLIRKILEVTEADIHSDLENQSLGEALLAPTRIYVKSILQMLSQLRPSALCHITGGGFTENLPRVLPDDTVANIDFSSWPKPTVFAWLEKMGGMTEDEMRRTFNCGIGMIVVISEDQKEACIELLENAGETVYQIGHIASGSGPAHVVGN